MWSTLSRCIFLLIALSSPWIVAILTGLAGWRWLWVYFVNSDMKWREMRDVGILIYEFCNEMNSENEGVLFCKCFFFLLIQNWNNSQALTSFFMGEVYMLIRLLANPTMLSAWYFCIFSILLDVVPVLKYMTVTLFVVDRWLYFWVN